jgi:predicted nucleotidyltransferase
MTHPATPISADVKNLALLQTVAAALGPLRDSLVFVGGCAVALLVTNVRAQPIRMTEDVDLVAQVASLRDYHQLEKQFETLGFTRDMRTDAPICRWRNSDVVVDLMPSTEGILGFHNRWYPLAVETAVTVMLGDGNPIRLVSAPVFIATKIEAFKGRGKSDYLASHDLEDIITVVDGRESLLNEIAESGGELRDYLKVEIARMLVVDDFLTALPGQLPADRGSQARLPGLLEKLKRIAEQ